MLIQCWSSVAFWWTYGSRWDVASSNRTDGRPRGSNESLLPLFTPPGTPHKRPAITWYNLTAIFLGPLSAWRASQSSLPALWLNVRVYPKRLKAKGKARHNLQHAMSNLLVLYIFAAWFNIKATSRIFCSVEVGMSEWMNEWMNE